MPKQDGKEVGLFAFSNGFRNREAVRNKYKSTDEYNVGHPNAKSDGDELGKGENNGSIGSRTDIRERRLSEARNFFTKNNPYDISKT